MKSFAIRSQSLLRHPLFVLLIAILPCLATCLHFLHTKQKQETLKQKIRYLDRKNRDQKLRGSREASLLARIQNADPDYVQKTLESLSFLNGEAKRIEASLLDHPADKTLQRRFQFLKGEANRLKFREKNFQRVGKLQEVDVEQEHPVEMGTEDLKCLLSKLEHIPIGPYSPDANSPDFWIEKFEMIRKTLSKDEETYLVKLNLIKRETIHE